MFYNGYNLNTLLDFKKNISNDLGPNFSIVLRWIHAGSHLLFDAPVQKRQIQSPLCSMSLKQSKDCISPVFAIILLSFLSFSVLQNHQEDLTYTCYQMYVSRTQSPTLRLCFPLPLCPFHLLLEHVPRRTPTGLSPEYVNFNVGSGKVRRRLMDLSIAVFKTISPNF